MLYWYVISPGSWNTGLLLEGCIFSLLVFSQLHKCLPNLTVESCKKATVCVVSDPPLRKVVAVGVTLMDLTSPRNSRNAWTSSSRGAIIWSSFHSSSPTPLLYMNCISWVVYPTAPFPSHIMHVPMPYTSYNMCLVIEHHRGEEHVNHCNVAMWLSETQLTRWKDIIVHCV